MKWKEVVIDLYKKNLAAPEIVAELARRGVKKSNGSPIKIDCVYEVATKYRKDVKPKRSYNRKPIVEEIAVAPMESKVAVLICSRDEAIKILRELQ